MLSIINYIGIKESSRYNIIATVIEASGLILVIMIWLFFFRDSGVDLLETAPQGFPGVITATALIFFAYIGFENIANISEEAKNPTQVIPKALILSIIISTLLYILVSHSFQSLFSAGRNLSASEAPSHTSSLESRSLTQARSCLSSPCLRQATQS